MKLLIINVLCITYDLSYNICNNIRIASFNIAKNKKKVNKNNKIKYSKLDRWYFYTICMDVTKQQCQLKN